MRAGRRWMWSEAAAPVGTQVRDCNYSLPMYFVAMYDDIVVAWMWEPLSETKTYLVYYDIWRKVFEPLPVL